MSSEGYPKYRAAFEVREGLSVAYGGHSAWTTLEEASAIRENFARSPERETYIERHDAPGERPVRAEGSVS